MDANIPQTVGGEQLLHFVVQSVLVLCWTHKNMIEHTVKRGFLSKTRTAPAVRLVESSSRLGKNLNIDTWNQGPIGYVSLD